jgi:ABC-type Mn2+/Zn2+ transport system ATPase subunit
MILGELISLGTAFFWTFTAIGFENAGRRVGSLPVNIIRLVIGMVLLTLTIFIMTGSFIPIGVGAYSWNMLLISGVIGLVIGDLFLFQAFVDIGGRISLLIYCSVPIMTAILGYFIFDEIFDFLTILGMVITLSAISVVVLSKRSEKKTFEPHVIKGITFAFIGAVAQSFGFDDSFPITVLEVVLTGTMECEIRPFFRYSTEQRRKAKLAIEMVGLENFDTRGINQLSGGQLKRVIIARAIASDAKIIILDEPDSNLDLEALDELYALLTSLKSVKTIIIVSHNIDYILDIADEAVYVNKTIQHFGTPKHLKDKLNRGLVI